MAGLVGVMREDNFCVGKVGLAVDARGDFGILSERYVSWDL